MNRFFNEMTDFCPEQLRWPVWVGVKLGSEGEAVGGDV